MELKTVFEALAKEDMMRTLTLGAKAVYGRSHEGLHIISVKRNDYYHQLYIDGCPAGTWESAEAIVNRIKDETLLRK
jgi:hypothetical protein